VPPARCRRRAEALLAEPVRQAALGNLLQALADRGGIAPHLAQHQPEAVAGQCAALQLAVVPGRFEHLDLVTGQTARSGAMRLGRCTLKRWVVTAWRSFMPA
jgi:hypothetical protein